MKKNNFGEKKAKSRKLLDNYSSPWRVNFKRLSNEILVAKNLSKSIISYKTFTLFLW